MEIVEAIIKKIKFFFSTYTKESEMRLLFRFF